MNFSDPAVELVARDGCRTLFCFAVLVLFCQSGAAFRRVPESLFPAPRPACSHGIASRRPGAAGATRAPPGRHPDGMSVLRVAYPRALASLRAACCSAPRPWLLLATSRNCTQTNAYRFTFVESAEIGPRWEEREGDGLSRGCTRVDALTLAMGPNLCDCAIRGCGENVCVGGRGE